jgi:DNA primase
LNYADSPKSLSDGESQQNLSDFLVHETEDVTFTNKIYKEIYDFFRDHVLAGKVVDSHTLLKNGSDAVKAVVTDLITSRYEISPHWGDKYHILIPREKDVLNELALSNVYRLKFRIVQKMINDNMNELKSAEAKGDWEEIDKALEVQIGLKKAEGELANMLGIVVAK